MSQIFGIHCINGLPDIRTDPSSTITSLTPSSAPDIYNIQLIENLSDSVAKIQAQSTSSVYISSDIVSAKVFIDGVEQIGCNTPSLINNIPYGYHNFTLKHPEYMDTESEISLDPGKTYNIFLTMGKLYQNSISIGSSDIIILLALGILGYLLIRKK